MRDIEDCFCCGSKEFKMEKDGVVEVYTCKKCGDITSYNTKWKMWADGGVESWDE
jgi:hypothetical protein